MPSVSDTIGNNQTSLIVGVGCKVNEIYIKFIIHFYKIWKTSRS